MASKRVEKNRQSFNTQKLYGINEAIDLLKEASNVKFVESFDVAVQTGVDPKKFMVRGASVLPNGTGRSSRVAVFASGELAKIAKEAGAHAVGMDDLCKDMEQGNLNYDVVIAVPEAMGLVGKIGKVLGPKGLMPNPKTGTVTSDVKGAVKNALNGQVTFRLDKSGIVHCSIGRVNFEAKALIENLMQLLDDLRKAKPSGAKGTYLKQVVLSTTMGLGLKVDINSIKLGE